MCVNSDDVRREKLPVKRHRGEPGHTRDAHGTRGRTRAHGSHRRTSQPSKPTNTQPAHEPARQRDGRNRGRLNSRRPGADRSPRSTQKRPPPANLKLPVILYKGGWPLNTWPKCAPPLRDSTHFVTSTTRKCAPQDTYHGLGSTSASAGCGKTRCLLVRYR